jgi:hypothetical protein
MVGWLLLVVTSDLISKRICIESIMPDNHNWCDTKCQILSLIGIVKGGSMRKGPIYGQKTMLGVGAGLYGKGLSMVK